MRGHGLGRGCVVYWWGREMCTLMGMVVGLRRIQCIYGMGFNHMVMGWNGGWSLLSRSNWERY